MERVVIIDESADARDVLVTYLRDLFDIRAGELMQLDQMLEAFAPNILIFSLERQFPLKQIVPRLKEKPNLLNTKILSFISDANPLTLEFLYDCQIDDYLVRPIDFNQLYWKLRSLSRTPLHLRVLTLGPFTLYPETNEIHFDNKDILVPEIQMQLLMAFCEHPNRILTREWLMTHVWRGQNLSNRSIDAQISKLKTSLPQISGQIISVYGKGYLFRQTTNQKTG